MFNNGVCYLMVLICIHAEHAQPQLIDLLVRHKTTYVVERTRRFIEEHSNRFDPHLMPEHVSHGVAARWPDHIGSRWFGFDDRFC